MPRFAVCSFLERDAVPELFRRDAIPPHVTVMGNFRSDAGVSALRDTITRAAERLPVSAVIGADAEFGANKDVAVVVLDFTDEIAGLHMGLLDELSTVGIDIETPEYSGQGFRAHITRTPGWNAAVGDPVVLRSLSLIQLDAERGPRRHRVVATSRSEGPRDGSTLRQST